MITKVKAINTFLKTAVLIPANPGVCRRLILACALCSTMIFGNNAFAQNKSTLGQFDDKADKHRAPFKLAKQSKQALGLTETKAGQTQIPSKKADAKNPTVTITSKRRAELMEFVNKHHPELRPLLNSLKRTRQGQYQSALTALDRDVRNLQNLQKRSPERYQRSLEQWTIKSNLKLLTAQLALQKSEEGKASIEEQVKTLVMRQHELRLVQAKDDLAAARKRVERLEAIQVELQTNREKIVQQQQNSVKKSAQRIVAAQKKAAAARKQAKVNAQPATDKKQDDKKNK